MQNPLARERPRLPAFQPYLPPGAAALRDLPLRGCHWPIGDVEQDGFRFCGAPNRLGRSYCAAHGQLALRRRR